MLGSWGISAAANYISISTIPNARLPCMSKDRWPTISAFVFPIGDLYLFGGLKQQLSGRTLDSEEYVLEMSTEILSELPKDEFKSAFVHWKERCQ
jgi:hypothetical protein